MTIDETSRVPTLQLRTYTKAEIIESLKTKVHKMYSPDKQIIG